MSTLVTDRRSHVSSPPAARVRGDVRVWILDVQFWLIGIAPALSAVAAPRYFDENYTTAISAGPSSSALGQLAYLVSGRGILLAGLLGVVAVLPTLRVTRAGGWLAFGFCALAASSVLSSQLGTVSASLFQALPLLLVGLSWYFAPVVDVAWLARRLVWLVRFYVVGSLVAVVLAPSWALEANYPDSFLPGVGFRLHGFAPHANLLAPIVLLGLICEGLRPSRRRSRYVWRAAGVTVLVLTQSKTTLVAGVAVLLVEWFRRTRYRETAQRLVADAALVAGSVLLGFFVWQGTALSETSGGRGLETLRAREDVWSVTLGLWHHNPAFGYGLKLWNTDMRLSYLSQLGWAPPHAHNQLVQTLGEAGLVGVVALAVYVAAMLHAGVRMASLSNGVALAVVVLMLVRALTECPLARAGGDLLLPFAAYVILLTLLRSAAEGMATRSRPDG